MKNGQREEKSNFKSWNMPAENHKLWLRGYQKKHS